MLRLGAILLVVLAVGAACLLVIEVRRWAGGSRFISRRRFVIRLFAGGLLLGLLLAIAAGLYWFDPQHYQGKPAFLLTFWTACLLAGLALLALAIADLREVGASFTRFQHQAWKDFARFLASRLEKENPASRGPGDDGRSR